MISLRQCLACLAALLLLALSLTPFSHHAAQNAADFDLVILNGRVVDPESGLDAVRNLGIRQGTIRSITTAKITGKTTIDAKGLVVAPGFIDLHVHDMTDEHHRAQAMDGVTTAFELEIGADDIDRWYAERAGKTLINYGVSVGHIPVRMRVLRDPGVFVPVADAAHKVGTAEELAAIKQGIEQGLRRGAVAVGFGINYTEAATRWEILEMFRVAARFNASCHVHLRYAGFKEPESAVAALEEVLAAAAVTGAPLHVVHVTSMGLRDTPRLLQMIGEARGRGMDVTTEVYPYTAGMTGIESAIFDDGWQERMGITYSDLQWAATGERLTAQSFARYRKTGGMMAIHNMTEDVVNAAIANPMVMIASDGILKNGQGHPRSSGTYARVLGRYVREQKTLSLMDAVRKMTLLPAERLEGRVPAMKNKGRLRAGADADITIFDADHVIDRATFSAPSVPSEGIHFVLVGGVPVVSEGKLQSGVAPGRPVRGPLQ